MPLASHPSQVSALPSTAPVHEYICLFTPDLKRKQKRWQDGRLKFHTFNKRIMVYDERGNFIGDMHWREDFDFCQGEEFNLERGAVIVQVAECIGTKDQDLSELLDKRAKEVDQRHARSSASAISSPMASARPSLVSRQQPQPQPQQMQQQLQHPPHGQFRQKHLADLFNTPRGPQGRAVIPKTSPYEERVAAQASSPHDENQRPAKRRKRDVSPPSKAGYAQNLFGTALTLSSWSASAPVRSQPLITPISQGFRPSPPCRDPKASSSRPAAVVDLTDGSQIPSVACQISDELPKSIAKRMPTADVNSVPKPSTITEKRKPTSRSARKSQDVEETLDSSDQRAPSNAYTNNRSRLPDPPQDDRDQTRQPGLTRSSTNEDVIEKSQRQDFESKHDRDEDF
ncbi:hypothetical protein CkaCkLH20_13017 [Colletotrichum karsti]|uniref:5'-3' DNA helicase ZGRF1-like N-terminal domain-containing protein n=1 Tax=Colletotrichum karsti TaxID=1095194 RepID=A0A9P6HS20_9PEZI|nr:uncharacterized protein CkaCkLH20_13017 [Colletotrichum karsti]KAF9869532.1 hypothetical protein CkaCkLH20_13017 [Colletotrichum karsti]